MELFFTMLIASILVAVAVPSFRSLMANNRLVTQTNDLIAALTLARSEAITRNSTMTFCRTEEEEDAECAGEAGDWSFWIILNAAGDVVRSGSIPSYDGVLIVTSSMTDDTMTYSSDGLARTGAPPVLLANANRLRVCVTTIENENVRAVTPGVGSRLSTTKTSGPCS